MPDASDQTTDLGSLLHAAFRGLRHSWVEELAPWEITPFQWRALHNLLRCPDPMRLGELADRLRIAARSATEVVDHLERRGLVERTPDPHDRRAVIVVATQAGRQLHEAVEAARRERSDAYFGQLTADERSELAGLLRRLGSSD